MPASNVDLFTVAMRTEFINSYGSVAEPTPLNDCMQVIPSNTRVENYAHLYPAPGVAEFTGSRRFVRIGESSYLVRNKTFDSSFSVKLDDIDDDQTGGYKIKAQELAQKMKNWQLLSGLIGLARGQTDQCFDGTAFFADSHVIGTGDNKMAVTANGTNDGATHYLYFLYTGGPVKPLFWQDREKAQLFTDAGSESSQKAREVRYWADCRGAIGYGYWYDAIQCTITNTPAVYDLIDIYATAKKTFRGFKLPKTFTGAQDEYIHQMHSFNSGNMVLLCSTGIEAVVDASLTRSTFAERVMTGASTVVGAAAPDNNYKGWAKYFCGGILDSLIS